MEKKISFYLMLMMIMGVGVFTSCGDDDDPKPEPSRLTISLSNIEMGREGGSVEVDVRSNTKWYVSGATDWCTVSPKESENNGVFDVTISENLQPKERKCTLKVRTSDGAVVEEIAVTQSAKGFLNATGPIVFAKEKGNKKVLQISSNVSWEIIGIPEWLDCSQRSGNDSRDVEFTTKTENTKGTRSATLTVKATDSSSLSATVEVTQDGKSPVKVIPKGLVTLYDCLAYLPQKVGDVKRFKAGWIKASYYNTMSENEILEWIRSNGAAFTEFNELHSMHSGLAPETDYYLLTLAYDNNDEEGEIVNTPFRTQPINDDQAWVQIGSLYRNSSDQIWWEANPDGATDKYYTAYVCGLTSSQLAEFLFSDGESVYIDDAKLAWLLNNEIELNSGRYKVKKGAAEILEEKGYFIENNRIVPRGNSMQLGYAVFFAWGVNVSDNKMSGILTLKYTNVSLDESGKKVMSTPKEFKVRPVRRK